MKMILLINYLSDFTFDSVELLYDSITNVTEYILEVADHILILQAG